MFHETGGPTRRWRRDADAAAKATPAISPVVDYEHARPEWPRFTRERDWEAITFGAVMVVALLLLLWFVIIPYFRAPAA